VCGIVEYDPQFKTDRLASGMLDFGRGTATFTCSTQLASYQRVNIFGDTGRIEIEIPFNAPPDRPCRLFVGDGRDPVGAGAETREFAVCDQYTIEADAFSAAILNGTAVPLPLEDSVKNMRVIDAIVRSAETGTWQAP
jgi:predicted dehydrogenase